jgi:general secretion pathway protein J
MTTDHSVCAVPMPFTSAPPLRPQQQRHRRLAGFTLVEVLVALSILAVMAGMAWEGLDSVMRGRDVTAAHTEKLLRLQSVLTQWEADLTQAVDTQAMPAISFDGANLHITRLHEGEVRLVVWSLRGGRLLRWSSPDTHDMEVLQDAWMRSQQLLGDEPGSLVALQGVADWQMYFFDQSSSSWRNAQSSGDQQQAEAPAPPASGASAPSPAGRTDGAGREAMPDGARLLLNFAAGATDASGSGSVTRDVRLVHP